MLAGFSIKISIIDVWKGPENLTYFHCNPVDTRRRIEVETTSCVYKEQ